MTTHAIADRYYQLAQQDAYGQIQEELYADHCRSYEPEHTGIPPAEGMEALKAKGQRWRESVVEVHANFCNYPIVTGDYFALVQGLQVTFKESGYQQREELCVFRVAEGKIVEERFFY